MCPCARHRQHNLSPAPNQATRIPLATGRPHPPLSSSGLSRGSRVRHTLRLGSCSHGWLSHFRCLHAGKPPLWHALYRRDEQSRRPCDRSWRRPRSFVLPPVRVTRLVWFESHRDIRIAIQREKSMKRWPRAWKINLIERENPHWQDLLPSLVQPAPLTTYTTPSGAMDPGHKAQDDTRG
jgi:hypothetical protein